ncbi:histidine phosphatase family protein [Nocardioides sp. 616]|uniref:histidine phosphatase family protein n=1 Tax=Nocardioides sp. 616 TaxID=2268090 RepID=UPI000CE3416A|nr:histidine phosphatase family protein [Nocardioides sp. 616]
MTEPRRLLLLRHGQTAWNAEHRAQGQRDVPLDQTGLLQAKSVAPVLAAMEPAFVRSSDLARARVTAETVADAAGVSVATDARLREFDLGARTGQTMAEYAATHPEEFRRFRAGQYDVAPGGESRATVTARVTGALDDALAALAPGELGIVVGHGAATKVSLLEWLALPPAASAVLGALGNCHWALVDDSGDPTGPADGRRLVAYNRHA